ncbi:Flagellum-specific peptidoglycan hydrolase FlgJ [Formosa sp. Hel1_31_208]|uniref:glucosaminidase domain-containing protein n=1 Tax=Formosa sp. Hel1_31_208 TaxID=1798225 RepID=UPI00087CBAAD|nr:glucosaminidase domain-containing protein [Formosa sp. Hel1_31_208]SDR65861.1 Flagellum-specific peptidoglycan hydrolase FlgJ [Formosa sp. Hel1_31_208]
MKKIIVLSLMSLVLFGCGSKKRIVTKKEKTKQKTERVVKTTSPTSETPNNAPALNATELYIANYSVIAMEEMRKSKIPASITLAQGILESGSGKGRLSVMANNHFGIKCHGWKGKKIYHDDDKSQECFRKYNQAKLSFEDHSEFLTSRGRYSKLFQLKPDDYEGWAKGLRAAGYATDKKYPEKLISLVERYNLASYDAMVLGGKPENYVSAETVSMNHKVVKGDTLYSLSKRYKTTVEELKRLNDLETNDLILGQILIIKSN